MNANAQMKAVVLDEHSDRYDVLRACDVARPAMRGPRDVLVEVHAAGFNPFDCKLRKGWLRRFYPFELPHVLGNDIAGVVVEKGPAVFELNVGDRVYGLQATMRWGGYAEYCAIDASFVRRIPKALSFEQAAAVPMVLETAWLGLVDLARVRAGQFVLVHGAAGGVGSMAVQLARACGATVAGTCAADAVDMVRDLGAQVVIDYQNQDFTKVLRDVDTVFDPIGGEVNLRSYEVMKAGGVLLTVLREDKLEMENRDRLCRKHDVSCKVIAFENHAVALDGAAGFFESNAIVPPVKRVVPLALTAEAHKAYDAGHARGKTVIKVK